MLDELPADLYSSDAPDTPPATEETDPSDTDPSDTAAPDEVVYGDVNGDGTVSIADVLALNKNLMIGETLSEQSIKNADVDCDGEPTSADALNILKYAVKILKELPVK